MDGPQRNDYKADFLRDILKDFKRDHYVEDSKTPYIHPNLLLEILDPDNEMDEDRCREAIARRYSGLNCYYITYWNHRHPQRYYLKNAKVAEDTIMSYIMEDLPYYKINYHIVRVKIVTDPKNFICAKGQFAFKSENGEAIDQKEIKKLNLDDRLRLESLDDFQIQIFFGRRKTAEELKESYLKYCEWYNQDPLKGHPKRPLKLSSKYWRV
jgi:hypothetical protein